MHGILAIALLSLRSAVRSRMVAVLMLLLVGIMALLPWIIKGDGTISGIIHLMLSYSLGLATTVIAMALLWAGSFAVSAEIQDKTIQTLATKPISRFHLWAGKWLGLNLLGLLLLAFCGTVTYGLLHLQLTSERWTPDELATAQRQLTAHAEYPPIQPDFEAEARRALTTTEPTRSDDRAPAEILQQRRQTLIADFFTVRPLNRNQWTFPSIPGQANDQPIILRYRFTSSVIGQEPVSGRWLIGTTEKPDQFTHATTHTPRVWNEIRVTRHADWASKPIVVTYLNEDPNGATLLFDLDQGLTLLAPADTFAANYLRVLLVKFAQLSFLTALGVTAGCLFSLPVAALISMYILLLVQLGSYIQGMATNEFSLTSAAGVERTAIDFALIAIYKGLAFLLSPLVPGDELTRLANGLLVPWWSTLRHLVLQGLVFALLLGAFSSYALNRRELALPQS
jgi:hypothetical protein